MKYRNYDAQRDGNEPAIVDALRGAGASVVRLHQPSDLLVGYRGTTYLIEVKRPAGPRGGTAHTTLNKAQRAFLAAWNGQHATVRTATEALEAIGVI